MYVYNTDEILRPEFNQICIYNYAYYYEQRLHNSDSSKTVKPTKRFEPLMMKVMIQR